MATTPIALAPPQPGQPCPCGTGKLFENCCEPLLRGRRPAASAEELMRSRFTAHVAGDDAYLHRTYLPTASIPYVASAKPESAAAWTRLVVHSHEAGKNPNTAYVDFSAYYLEGEVESALQEKSEFVRRNGEWIFARPIRQGPAPVKAQPKVGRNDPCPCGSGRKFKHCCLGRTG